MVSDIICVRAYIITFSRWSGGGMYVRLPQETTKGVYKPALMNVDDCLDEV